MRTRRHLAVMAAGLACMPGCVGGGGSGGTWWFVLLALVMAGAAFAGWGFLQPRRRQRRFVVETYLEAEKRLQSGEAGEAIRIVREAKRLVTYPGLRAPLTQLEITALHKLGNVAGLLAIHGETPDAFCWQEDPALLVAEALVTEGRYAAFDNLFNWWHGRTNASKRWRLFQADKLVREGNDIAALEVLNRHQMDGRDEAGRLARLAVLSAAENPAKAAALMAQALKRTLNDPDIRVLQGVFHEKSERDKADAAFELALRFGKNRPLIVDAAGEYFRRAGRLERALEVWLHALAEPSLDAIWLKVLFFRRVYRPIEPVWDQLTPPPGNNRELIYYMQAIPQRRFWNAEEFQSIASRRPLLLSRPEVHWLRVLEALRVGDEDEALSLLNVSRFGERSWHQDLETALIWMLTYRRLKFMNPELVLIADDRLRVEGRHPLFATLDNWVRGEAGKPLEFVQRLVVSDEAFAAACLAAGWYRAGLILHRVPLVRHEAPDWLVRDYDAALNVCKNELDEMRASS